MLKPSEIIEVMIFEETYGSRQDSTFSLLSISSCKVTKGKKGKKKVMSIKTTVSGELIICYSKIEKKKVKNAKK